MTTIVIKHFKEKHQNRVTFVRLLSEFNPSITLKPAKELLDSMLEGTSIEYQIPTQMEEEFKAKLDELNLEYEIKSG